MRSLTKSAPPEILVAQATKWTAEYVTSGGKTSPWAHQKIKAALILETSGKCAYCEARMLAVSFGDIEHIKPKSRFPEQVVSWENLTLACSRCNSRKSSKYDEDLEFINPYVDNPDEHLFFLGPVIYDRSDRGMYTIHELDLNDMSRVEARMRAIGNVANLVSLLRSATSITKKRMFEELIREILEEGEYSAAVYSYALATTSTAALRQ